MAERYPDDSVLLSLVEDGATGVEYIPTGRSPYHLEFRKLIQRLALSAQRANDLRVYQDGDLTLGVRPGRCLLNGSAVSFGGLSGIGINNNTITKVWLSAGGLIQTGEAFPADRTAFVPLAEVVSGSSSIGEITDLRGEAFLFVANLVSLGITASGAEINQALDGIQGTVDAEALNRLTAGPESTADSEHRHLQMYQDADGEVFFSLINNSGGTGANVALVFSLPNKLPDDTVLVVNRENGFLSQRYNGKSYNLVGAVQVQYRHEGDLTASQVGKLMGAVSITGTVTDVVLSAGTNLDSSVSSDHVRATVKVNGVAVTSTDPSIGDAAGIGFRSTARGDGTAAVIKSDGSENVQKGDVLTVDLTRSVSGTVSTEAANVCVMVVIRAGQPE